jgi:cysteine desulfurase / selenocysteine lyase
LPYKFEAGTPPIVPAIGLAAAIDYLSVIDFEALAEHERRLTERTHEVLGSIGSVRILGPAPARKGGIVSFVFEGDRPHAHDVAEIVDRYGVALRGSHHCAMPLHDRYGVTASARVSFYLYNTLNEVDVLGNALQHAKRLLRRK